VADSTRVSNELDKRDAANSRASLRHLQVRVACFLHTMLVMRSCAAGSSHAHRNELECEKLCTWSQQSNVTHLRHNNRMSHT
jgi:hypothetical protein